MVLFCRSSLWTVLMTPSPLSMIVRSLWPCTCSLRAEPPLRGSVSSPLLEESLTTTRFFMLVWVSFKAVWFGIICCYIENFSFLRNTFLIKVEHVYSCLLGNSLPFGGVGNSGCGSYHGKYSFDSFSHSKAVLCTGTGLEAVNR